ncbi:MAG TPA: SLBB domain-containing protein [Caulobacteraceae bacterium]|nr:SLBB domain-containing protein [Caulobacteraceae bacterium]
MQVPEVEQSATTTRERLQPLVRPAPKPGEFETYVARVLDHPVPRFGADLMSGQGRDFNPPSTANVPPDYVLNPGDELTVQTSGAMESNLRLVIDSDGRIFIPHVGSVRVAGVRYGDLERVLTERVGREFRNFKLSAAIARLHGIRVYVTGYAAYPGAYTLDSLSTLVNAVMAAGGPASGGSFRNIELRRDGQVVTDFDLYDLLLKGDKTRDAVLQNEDVIFIAPVGPQAAVTGSVNVEAIYEAKPGETLIDLLRFAGGPSSLADLSRAYVERLEDLDRSGWQQIDLQSLGSLPSERGDLLRVVSVADYARPQERQALVVKLEGEVDHPGRYYLPPGTTLGDLLTRAGGLTPDAFTFGTELDRVSVQRQQQAGFDEAIQNIELDIAASPLRLSPTDIDPLGATGRADIARSVVATLRNRKPDGRMVLALAPDAPLPSQFVLENDDRIYIPPKPTTVGVFGAVYRPGSFAFGAARTLNDYLRLAGGPQRIAESGDIFVVRANGSVVSRRQHDASRTFDRDPALPGDVIFVPVKTQPNLFWERLVQVTSVLYQFGLGAAALKVLSQ